MDHSSKNAEPAGHLSERAPSWAHRMTQVAWLLHFRGLPSADRAAGSQTEWDNDVPPFPILAGEVARAQAALASDTRQVRRGVALNP